MGEQRRDDAIAVDSTHAEVAITTGDFSSVVDVVGVRQAVERVHAPGIVKKRPHAVSIVGHPDDLAAVIGSIGLARGAAERTEVMQHAIEKNSRTRPAASQIDIAYDLTGVVHIAYGNAL